MRRVSSLFLLLSIFAGLAQAQSLEEKKPAERMIQLSLPHLEGQALETTVDPSRYILGPGDGLVVNIWGEEDMSLPLTVTPEGKLLIPSVGELEVSGLSLQEAKARVEETVLKRFRNVRVTTNLTSLRRFRIMVIGEVARPGTWVAQATDRVSDLLGWAGQPEQTEPGTKTLSEEEEEMFQHLSLGEPSQRNIVVTHRDSSQLRADIFRFLALGDRGRNPYLRDGDVVSVPPVEQMVNIYGAVNEPGDYEWVKGERVFDLIELARGLRPDADSSLILLTRFNPDGITTRTLRIDLRGQGDLTLMADDRVFVRSRPQYHLKEEVYLQGEVLHPGVYPIRKGFTTLSQVIKEAGGFTQQAAMELAKVIREGRGGGDKEFERLRNMDVSDMTHTEYEYFKMRARERSGELSVDFKRLFGQGDLNEDILLRDGDRIEVPPKPKVIWVLGQVSFPGGVEYIPGKPLSYYVEIAGGYGPNAQRGKIRVIRAKGKGWVWPKQAGRLKPGDTIWVPEKPERNWWQVAKEAMTVLSQVATVYIVIKQAVKP